MTSNRRVLLILLGVVIVALLALGGFFIWLQGGFSLSDSVLADESGLVHVRDILVYDSGTPVSRPVGVAADENGNIYVTMRDDAVVVKFDRDGDYISKWGGRGLEPGQLLNPMNVAVDSLAGRVYVADRGRLRVVAYDLDGDFLWETPILGPEAPAVAPDGSLLVATFGPVAQFSSEGEFQRQVGTRGLEPGQFDFPRSMDVDDEGSVYVADTNNTRVQKVAMSGELTATVQWVLGTPPRFQDDPETRFVVPSGITLDDDGNLYVLDGFRHEIVMVDAGSGEELYSFGERRGTHGGSFNLPTSITHMGGDLFAITDTFNDRVQIVRLLAPGENNVVSRNPWLWWLVPLALLPLLALLGRKRYFATEEALAAAVERGEARVLLAVTAPLQVLPNVRERFKDVAEEDVVLGEYLREVEADAGDEDSTEEVLSRAARPSALERLLVRRHRVVSVDREQAQRVQEAGAKAVPVDEITSQYMLDSD